MRTVRRAVATLALSSALCLGVTAPTAAAQTPTTTVATTQAKHVSAWLCIAGGGHVVHYPGFKLCIGGLFHGHLVL